MTGALKQSAPTVHVAHTVSQVEKLAAACAGHLLLQTHSLHGLTLRPALAAEELLLPVMNEFAFNLESFNPAFTATLLKVKRCRCTSVQRCFIAVLHCTQHCADPPAPSREKATT